MIFIILKITIFLFDLVMKFSIIWHLPTSGASFLAILLEFTTSYFIIFCFVFKFNTIVSQAYESFLILPPPLSGTLPSKPCLFLGQF